MNTNEFKAFWDNVRLTKRSPFSNGSELHAYLDKLTCTGCGAIQHSESSERCDDCYECGCYVCRKKYNYDGDMWTPFLDYSSRRNNAITAVWNIMKEMELPSEQLINIFGKQFVKDRCPYNSNKDLWRTFFLSEQRQEPCPSDVDYEKLSDEEKSFFRDPKHTGPPLLTYIVNYNIFRMMGGWGELRYQN